MRALILIISIAMTGCNSVMKIPEFKEVKIPVIADIPKPPKLEVGELEIDKLTPRDYDNHEKVVKSYVITVKQLQDHIDLQEKYLRPYRDL